MANTTKTVADILSALARRGVKCDLFGGWAEEILGVRPPGNHRDIDLVYRDESFFLLDMAIAGLRGTVSEVTAKRFRHKRAFIFRGTLCEITLVKDADMQPVTYYWGDTPFEWDRPFLHGAMVPFHDGIVSVLSADNLRKHRDQWQATQPHRWRDPSSREVLY
jgi:hypothetical protein